MRSKSGFDVDVIWQKHHEILNMSLIGMLAPEIVERTGFSLNVVNNVLRSAVGREKLDVMRGARDADSVDLSKRISNFLPKCIDLFEDVIGGSGVGKDANLALRVRTAQDYADRGGLVPIRKHQIASMHLTPSDLDRIKERAKTAWVIDVTPGNGKNGPSDKVAGNRTVSDKTASDNGGKRND